MIKARFKPSAEWTPDERLSVIAELAEGMEDQSGIKTPARDVIFDVAVRITAIATRPAPFLEEHRKAILNGNKTSPAR